MILRDLHTGNEAIATSAGVQFPTAAVGDWAEAGADGTVGDFLAQELKCDAQDPHDKLTKGQFARAALIENAIRVAVAQLVI